MRETQFSIQLSLSVSGEFMSSILHLLLLIYPKVTWLDPDPYSDLDLDPQRYPDSQHCTALLEFLFNGLDADPYPGGPDPKHCLQILGQCQLFFQKNSFLWQLFFFLKFS